MSRPSVPQHFVFFSFRYVTYNIFSIFAWIRIYYSHQNYNKIKHVVAMSQPKYALSVNHHSYCTRTVRSFRVTILGQSTKKPSNLAGNYKDAMLSGRCGIRSNYGFILRAPFPALGILSCLHHRRCVTAVLSLRVLTAMFHSCMRLKPDTQNHKYPSSESFNGRII